MRRSGFRPFQPSSQSCTKRKCDIIASPRGFEALAARALLPPTSNRMLPARFDARAGSSELAQAAAVQRPSGRGVLVTPGAHGVRSPLVAAMVQPPEPVSDAFQHALAEERLRSTRNLNLFRFQGLTIFLVLAFLLHICLPFQPIQPSLALFACYWAAAGAILLAS